MFWNLLLLLQSGVLIAWKFCGDFFGKYFWNICQGEQLELAGNWLPLSRTLVLVCAVVPLQNSQKLSEITHAKNQFELMVGVENFRMSTF